MDGSPGHDVRFKKSTWAQLTLCGCLVATALLVYFASLTGLPKGPVQVGSSFVALAIYVALLRSLLRDGQVLPSLSVVWVLGAILRIGLAGLYFGLALILEPSEPIRLGPVDVASHLLAGQATLLAGDGWLIAGLILGQRAPLRAPRLFRIRPSLSVETVAVGLVATTWVLRALDGSVLAVRGLGNFPGVWMQHGVAAGMFCGLVTWGTTRKPHGGFSLTAAGRILWPVVIAAIVLAEMWWQLHSYMRQGVLLALLPLFIFAWIQWRWGEWSGRVLASGAAVGLLVIGFVLWPYGQMRRADVDRTAGVRSLPVLPYLEEAMAAGIPGTEGWRRLHDFPDSGVWSLPSRMQLVSTAAGALHLRQSSPEAGAEQLSLFARNLIPRVVWPDKPPYSPGRRVAVELGQGGTFASVTTATALSLPGGAVWVLGPWIGLPLLAVTGLALSFLWRFWAPRLLRNPVAALGAMALWLQAFRMLESSVVLGWSAILYQAVVLVPLAIGWDLLWKVRNRSPRSARR